MTGIRLQGLKETGAFLITTALSCGPSQLFGCIKLIVDTGLILANNVRKHKINSNIQRIDNDWDNFQTSSKAILIASKLGIESDDLTQEAALNYFNAKNIKIEGKIRKLARSIAADACALIPLVGAHISWRIATSYEGKSFTPIFSRGVEQLLEHSKSMASRPLFWGRRSKRANRSKDGEDYIEISTSTKNRRLKVYDCLAQVLDDRGKRISGEWTPERVRTATVVLFHGANGKAAVMDKSAEFYRQKGYNVLYVQLGGYKGSPGVTTSEKSIYQDIEAVKRFLIDRGVTEVGYHGISMGTGAAMQAAAGDSLIEDLQTLFVVLDQPYASAGEVAGNIVGPLGKGVLSAGCPADLDVELPGGLWTKTDGLNNVRKATILKDKNIPLICIEKTEDAKMGRKKEMVNILRILLEIF